MENKKKTKYFRTFWRGKSIGHTNTKSLVTQLSLPILNLVYFEYA